MKLLLFSDLHADAEAARRLVERARTADGLIGAVDPAQGHREGVNVLAEQAERNLW